MSEYTSTTSLESIAATLREADRVVLTTHSKPDGDAMGSVLAMARALSGRGKHVQSLLMGPVPAALQALCADTPFTLVERQAPPEEFDVALVMDTGARSQVEPLDEWLKRHRERMIGIDHHARGDDIAPRRFIDTNAASTTEILVTLLDLLGCELSGGVGGVAEPLFVGLATDTGWFRFSKAQSRTFAVAARLLEVGVDKSRLYQLIEETYRPQRLALEARALASIEYVGAPTVAIMSLGPDDFQATGAGPEDMTGLVNSPMVVGDVRSSVLLSELEPGVTKMSFRSKPALAGGAAFRDVNELAQRFGGGGHTQAAGARVKMPLAKARAALLDALQG